MNWDGHHGSLLRVQRPLQRGQEIPRQRQQDGHQVRDQLIGARPDQVPQEGLLAPTNVGRLKDIHDNGALFDDVRSTLGKVVGYENRFVEVARDEKSLKKTLFYRTRHMVAQLEKSKMSLLFLINKMVTSMLQLVAGRNATVSSASSDWLYALESIDQFNRILIEFSITLEPESELKTLLHGIKNRSSHLHENFSPSHHLYLKQFTSSKVFQVLSSERAWYAAMEVVKSIVVGIERRQLEVTASEVSWLSIPQVKENGSNGEDGSPGLLEAPKVYNSLIGRGQEQGR